MREHDQVDFFQARCRLTQGSGRQQPFEFAIRGPGDDPLG